jgi:DNA ligase
MKRLLFLCLTLCFLPLKTYALDIMLPQVYKDNIHVVGWLMSEKLDGVRGYWDGKQLFSKNGFVFHPPEAFTRDLPPFPLEGELWGGYGTFEKTVSIVKKQRSHNGWLTIQFAIFDVPQAPGSFSSRIQNAANWFLTHPSRFAFVIPQQTITAPDQLQAELQRIEKLGGEGLIVRNPDAVYTTGRSNNILKVKNFFDMEAVVVAHIPGKGRNQGRLGSLLVELSEKNKKIIRFRIGSGLSDTERNNPPPIGAVITFKYYGFYKSGIPKFPSFMRIRADNSLSR